MTDQIAEERRWHYRRSLASRVILLTTMAVCLAVALVALAAFLTMRLQMQSTMDDSLLNRARQAARLDVLSDITRGNSIPSWMLGAADVRIIYVPVNEQPVTVDRGPPLQLGAPEYDVASGASPQSIRTVAAEGVRYRVAAVPNGDGVALVLAQSLTPQEKVLRRLGAVMLFFGIAGVLGAGAAGWLVARNGLRPVRRLTAAVEEIAHTERLDPLPIEGDDEVARLGSAFNQMLAALAASRDRQRRLVADAGHELRTPLTSLRTNLELLAQADTTGGLPPGARAELLSDVRAQIEELSTLVGDLIELARDEPLAHTVDEFDLAEVLSAAVARVRRRAPGVRFEVTAEPWWVVGESGAVERAVTNLLDNAAKWGPPDGTVFAELEDGTLTVDDEGPGIAPDDLPHVFDRFYRSQESRGMPGSGLGLSIVRQVVERHSGQVHASDAPDGGARMVMWLPGTPARDAGSGDPEGIGTIPERAESGA